MGLIAFLRNLKLSQQCCLSFEDKGTIIHRNIRNHSPKDSVTSQSIWTPDYFHICVKGLWIWFDKIAVTTAWIVNTKLIYGLNNWFSTGKKWLTNHKEKNSSWEIISCSAYQELSLYFVWLCELQCKLLPTLLKTSLMNKPINKVTCNLWSFCGGRSILCSL